MAQAYTYRAEVRKKQFRTLSMVCEDEALSDAQIKEYQTRLQNYRSFLDSVNRLAMCGNVCVTEETVTVGELGLLSGESLNALQHAGAISVYNTLQQNNWEFPIPEDSEVAVIKAHVPVVDEFLDSEKPVRPDWPSVHISDCFVDGERARLHGSVRPLRTFLPPTVIFRSAADVDEDSPDPELNANTNPPGDGGGVELVTSSKGISIRKLRKDGKEECIPIDEYYFGRQEGSYDYAEEKGDFRFKCAVCQRIFYSNTKLMAHILAHVDESQTFELELTDANTCSACGAAFLSDVELQAHIQQDHGGQSTDSVDQSASVSIAQTASQLLMMQRNNQTSTDQQVISDRTNASTRSGAETSQGFGCRICGKETTNELALAQHLQSSHRQCEMPYVCRLCLFRSSLYEDILDHFKENHANSNHLLCTYCLRIFTPSDARSPGATPGTGVGQTQVYLQHLRMHQVKNQLRKCPTCKLNFTNKSDYQVHRRLDHKATRSSTGAVASVAGEESQESQLRQQPKQGETTRVNTQLYRSADQVPPLGPSSQNMSAKVPTRPGLPFHHHHDPNVQLLNAPQAGGAKSLVGLNLPENILEQSCLECGQGLGTSNHEQYVPCSVCRFATCCLTGYNRHVQNAHVYFDAQRCTTVDLGSPIVRPVYFDWMAEEILKARAEKQRMKQDEVMEVDGEVTPAGEKAQLQETTQSLEKQASEKEETSGEGNKESLENGDQVGDSQVDEPMDDGSTTNVPSTDPQSTIPRSAETVTPEGESTPVVSESVPEKQLSQDPRTGLEGLDHEAIVELYMKECTVDAGLFYCIHCGRGRLMGNEVARHMVEECGVDTVTLNPDPALVAAKKIEMERRQQAMQQTTQGNDLLLQAFDAATTQATAMTGVPATTSGDSQATCVVHFAEPDLTETVTDTSVGLNTTQMPQTFEVTDASGQVVQQFIVPDDLQLEEGQTLVLITGEDGQPQLAIVNQADLMEGGDSQLLMQQEDDQSGTMIMYDSAIEPGETHVAESVVGSAADGTIQDEEKENQQYPI